MTTLLLLLESRAFAENLIPNPSVETVDPHNPNLPAGWEHNNWGTMQATFTYATNGQNGSRSLRLDIQAGTDGDAKWWSKAIPVPAGGGVYQVTDYYRSNKKSELMVQALGSGSTMQWITVEVLNPGAIWTKASQWIALPTWTLQVRVLHVLREIGWLETDSFAMEKEVILAPDGGILDGKLNRDGPGGSVLPPLISVVFDDGWLSVFKYAFPIMKKFGLRGTHYIHAEYVDKVGYQNDYMTSQQLTQIYVAGHEMGSHALSGNWQQIISDGAKVEEHLAKSKQILSTLGFAPVGFAPPNGAYNTDVLQKVKQHYLYMRTVIDGLDFPPYEPYLLKCQAVLNTTTMATIKGWVTQAIKEKGWLILLYHRLESVATSDTMVTPAQFEEQMSYLAQAGPQVLPAGEVLGMWKPHYQLLPDGDALVRDASIPPKQEAGQLRRDTASKGKDDFSTDKEVNEMGLARSRSQGCCAIGAPGSGYPLFDAVPWSIVLLLQVLRRRKQYHRFTKMEGSSAPSAPATSPVDLD